MLKYLSALFCALLVLSVLEPIACGRGKSGGSHSYPSSHGLSGSGSRGGLSGGHGYPSSGGSHGYPSSGGSHGYPSGGSHGKISGSGGSHGYPPSGGISGSGGSHGYPPSGGISGSGGSHGYPPSGGKFGSGTGHGYPPSSGISGSGSHGYPKPGGSRYPSSPKPSYPPSGGRLSGSGSQGYPNKHVTHTTTIHNHYHYNPPRQIMYAAPGHRPVSYPVYHGTPPTYVYQYKNSGSKYGTLLAGLALLNLGTLAGAAYVGSRSHSNYKPQPGEICKFAVKKSNGDYEETKIDCQLITSFIFAEEAKVSKGQPSGTNSTTITTTVTNVTVVNNTNNAPSPTLPPTTLYQMLPNGTLVPVNATQTNIVPAATMQPNGTLSPNDTMKSSVTITTTTTNTTVVNALDVKGKEIQVTPGMECFVIRHTPTQNMRKHVSCGLLQSYATQSLKPNSAVRNIPTFTILFAITAFVLY